MATVTSLHGSPIPELVSSHQPDEQGSRARTVAVDKDQPFSSNIPSSIFEVDVERVQNALPLLAGEGAREVVTAATL